MTYYWVKVLCSLEKDITIAKHDDNNGDDYWYVIGIEYGFDISDILVLQKIPDYVEVRK